MFESFKIYIITTVVVFVLGLVYVYHIKPLNELAVIKEDAKETKHKVKVFETNQSLRFNYERGAVYEEIPGDVGVFSIKL